jgi:hypothetical protein
MSYYAITMRNGTVSAMQLARSGIDPRAAIAKWPPEQQALVGDVIPIDRATYELICSSRRGAQSAPPPVQPPVESADASVPDAGDGPPGDLPPPPDIAPSPSHPAASEDKPGWGAILAAADAHEDRLDPGPAPEVLPSPAEEPAPAPMPAPVPVPAPPRAVDPRTDEQVRQEASETLQRAARAREAALLEGGEMAQIRYETAIKARNGSGDAQALLLDEARQRGMSVKDLAEQIIAERKAREAQVMRVYATLAKVERLLEVARRDEIEGLIAEGIAEMEGRGNG